MKNNLIHRIGQSIQYISEIYVLQPHTDYQAMISHSSAELSAKAWGRTGKQMQMAMRVAEKRILYAK